MTSCLQSVIPSDLFTNKVSFVDEILSTQDVCEEAENLAEYMEKLRVMREESEEEERKMKEKREEMRLRELERKEFEEENSTLMKRLNQELDEKRIGKLIKKNKDYFSEVKRTFN